jgi:hypothetical protein
MFHARDEIGVGLELEASERFGEVRRTYLASSTRAVDGLGKTELLFVHVLPPLSDNCTMQRGNNQLPRYKHQIGYLRFVS